MLAGTPPRDLKVAERCRLWEAGPNTSKEAEREATLAAWQEEWSTIPEGCPGARIRDLISNIRRWLDRPGGEVDFYLTQVITGHGDFQEYLHRIGKALSSTCIYCDQDAVDDAEHTLLVCPALKRARSVAQGRVLERWRRTGDPRGNLDLTLPNSGMGHFVEFITSTTGGWELGRAVATEVLST